MDRSIAFVCLAVAGLLGCSDHAGVNEPDNITDSFKRKRSDEIKQASYDMGVTNPLLIAGIANHESGLAQCWSELTWACKGPESDDCEGPVMAGAGDGACAGEKGGLGMFQLDAGTYDDTVAKHGDRVLTVEGNAQIGASFLLDKLTICPNTRDLLPSTAEATAWLNDARPGTESFETFLSAVAWCYNGCSPTAEGCDHDAVREKYRGGIESLVDAFGDDYWYGEAPAADCAGDACGEPPSSCPECPDGCGSCQCDADDLEPNDSSKAATPIASDEEQCHLSVCAGDVDWFEFDVTDGFEATLTFRDALGDLELEIYSRQTLEYVTGSYGDGNGESVQESGLEPGTYWARIYGADGAVNPDYCFRVTTY